MRYGYDKIRENSSLCLLFSVVKKDGISVAKNNERLLSAWRRLSVIVCNERVVSDMPYNEALICSLLVKAGECRMTATELCEKTKMFKSQMNRTLHSLEEKGMLERRRSSADKRRIDLSLTAAGREAYEKEHARILKLVDAVIEKFGGEKTETLIDCLESVSSAADEILF